MGAPQKGRGNRSVSAGMRRWRVDTEEMEAAPQPTVQDDLVPLDPLWRAHVSQQGKQTLTSFHIRNNSLPLLLLRRKTVFYLFIAEWGNKKKKKHGGR